MLVHGVLLAVVILASSSLSMSLTALGVVVPMVMMGEVRKVNDWLGNH